jgi:hypothetical protein
MQTFLAFCNICIILFGFYKFLGKPHSNLEERVKKLEYRMEKVEDSLKAGNKRFKGQNEGITIIIKSIIALIEWEFQYCADEHKLPSEPLRRAKEDLNEFLASRRGQTYDYEDEEK